MKSRCLKSLIIWERKAWNCLLTSVRFAILQSPMWETVSEQGIATDPLKVEAVSTWPRPQNLSALRSFLGFCCYCRRFVRGYSCLIRPLNQLLQGYPLPPYRNGSRPKPVPTDKTYFHPSEPFEKRWNDQCVEAFQKINKRLTKAPVLAFADPQSLMFCIWMPAWMP